MMPDDAYEVWPARELTRAFVSGFYWRSVTWAWRPQKTHLGCSLSGPSRGEMDTVWPRAPGEQKQALTINYIMAINYLGWPKAPNIQRCSNQAEISEGIEGFHDQGPNLSLECVGFELRP